MKIIVTSAIFSSAFFFFNAYAGTPQLNLNGYRAEYHAIYDGTDPRSKAFPIGPLANPIEFTCTQIEEL